MPLISVVLPARDAAATLPSAVESILSQSFSDWELLLIDDHSRDATREMMDGVCAQDSRIRVFESPSPGGIVSALNAGIEHTKGELIARMDADDVSLPTRFDKQIELLNQRPDIAVAGCQVSIHRAGARPDEGYRRYEEWLNACVTPDAIWRERFIESPVAHPTAIIRRVALEKVGGYADTPWAEDYDLWLRMLAAGMRMAKVPEVLLNWSDGPNRFSRRDPRYSQEQFLRCRAHHLARIPRVSAEGVVIWAAGPIGKTMARLLQGDRIAVHRFVDIHPRRVGETIHGAPVVAPETERGGDAAMHLAAAGQPGRREKMRDLLRGLGKEEGEEFLCVA